jgi:hypothetical protein
MIAKGAYELMANRSDRRLPTLLSVRADEAAGMIRDAGARISIMAMGISFTALLTGRIYDCTASPHSCSPCTRARSIYDRQR